MAKPFLIDTFLSLESTFRSSINTLHDFNQQYFQENPNAKWAIDTLLGRIEIIKASIILLSDNIIDSIIERLNRCWRVINNLNNSTANLTVRTLSIDELNIALNSIEELNSFLNVVWDELFVESNRKDEHLKASIEELNLEKQQLRYELNNLMRKGEEDAKAISELKKSLEVDLNEIRERYKESLGDYELLAQEKIFREEADNNNKGTAFWIRVIIGLTVILLLICTWFMYSCWLDFTCLFTKYSIGNFYQSNKWQTLFYYELFRPVLIRLFILSIIVLLIKFSIRNYNALMHNKTVNMHKANSLAAMIRIINSLQNEETRNTLINLAGKEIFLHQKTGYLRKDDTKIDLNVLEKLLSLLQKKE